MDEKKLGELYKEYAGGIYHYLLRLSGSTEKAADLLQETFLRIFRYFDSQKRVQKQKSYFFKIAYNLFISSIRKDKKNSNIDIEKIEIPDQADNFSHKIHFQMLKEAIIKKLEQEDEVYSQIFLLRVDYEMTLKEIARVMNISFSTIRHYFEKIQNIILQNFSEELNIENYRKKK